MKTFKPGEFIITNENYGGIKFIAFVLKRLNRTQYNVFMLTGTYKLRKGILYSIEMERLCI
jgi:hypothetical protein